MKVGAVASRKAIAVLTSSGNRIGLTLSPGELAEKTPLESNLFPPPWPVYSECANGLSLTPRRLIAGPVRTWSMGKPLGKLRRFTFKPKSTCCALARVWISEGQSIDFLLSAPHRVTASDDLVDQSSHLGMGMGCV
jgi:hypothetical protein